MTTRGRWLTAIALAGLLLAAGVVLWNRGRPADEWLELARKAAAKQDFAAIEEYAKRALRQRPGDAEALLLAGRAAAEQSRPHDALAYLEQIPDDGSAVAVNGRCSAGDVLLVELKELTAAEAQYRRAYRQNPQDLTANERLAYLLGLAGRSGEAEQHRLEQIRQGKFSAVHLYLLCSGADIVENLDEIETCYKTNPGDPLAALGMAKMTLQDGRPKEAEAMLRRAVRARPELLEAQSMLGQLLARSSAGDDFWRWHAQLNESADGHSGVWAARGFHFAQQGETAAAIRCLAESVRLDPNRQETIYQLSRLLAEAGEESAAEPFVRRAGLLLRYENTVRQAKGGQSAGMVLQAAELAEALGLVWEAYAWHRLALTFEPPPQAALDGVGRLEPKLPHLPLERASRESNPVATLDLAAYPLPRWPQAAVSRPAPVEAVTDDGHRVVFSDDAAANGISFEFFNGSETPGGARRMWSFTGGGAAVLDYDGDGRPDICFTQGCRWPPDAQQQEHLDRLYRNTASGFEDVTAAARLAENRFSQGATVGDINNDGFPDLYVGNIGPNRLYVNNGDGTFSDASSELFDSSEDWTTSCLLADLNGDSIPDVYAVNYLSGDDLFERVCRADGSGGSLCRPQDFPAAFDRFFLGRGDGTFDELTEEAGFLVPDGKGLGIVAADFDGTGRLDLFVANDTVANFYFVNRTEAPGASPRFVDQALQAGLALNGEGLAEACMGMAAGDADGDGLLDLFVTNFFLESNTLYRLRQGGLFTDATRRAGLHESSIHTLGFGTQFLDADLDGRLDLIITNGHIDDTAEGLVPYRMPPQYYHSAGEGRFVEVAAATLGPYFGGTYLGRGLARLDWNRDGREDVVITHINSPAALLTNNTPDAGHFLAVRLCGTSSARDAIGANVTVTCNGRRLVRQLTAGDGYQASNERQLIFGLADSDRIEELKVRWPSGLEQTFAGLAGDAEWLLIEGNSRAFLMP